MIVQSAGSVEGRRTGGGSPRRGTVGSPTGLLMIDLMIIDVPDYVDLLVLERLMPVRPLLHSIRGLMQQMVLRLLPLRVPGWRRVLLLVRLIVHAGLPLIPLPLFRHETAWHSGDADRVDRHRGPTMAMLVVVVAVQSPGTTTRGSPMERNTRARHHRHRHPQHQPPQHQPQHHRCRHDWR